MKNKFKIIPQEHTPKIEKVSIPYWIDYDKKILIDFLKFCYKFKNCIGLASNQVALNNERLMLPLFSMKDRNGWGLYIHPEIVEYIGEPLKVIEGCMTWYGKKIVVDRYPTIRVKYFDMKGKCYDRDFNGYLAQIFQHEVDHLNGVVEEFL